MALEEYNSSPVEIFQKQWDIYQWILDNNVMGHREIIATVRAMLSQYYQAEHGHMLDLGCGNAQIIPEIVKGVGLNQYTGVDQCPQAMEQAQGTVGALIGNTGFIKSDLFKLSELPEGKVDFIYTSYAVHHGDSLQKSTFFESMHQLAEEGGILVFIDIFCPDIFTREALLNQIDTYFHQWKALTPSIIETILHHVQNFDYPETIATYEEMAAQAGWQLLEQRKFCIKENFHFIVMAFRA